jgi:hypothetical protein
MSHVVFVAPRFMENTLRYVRAFSSLPDVELSLVSGDPERALPRDLRARIAGHYRVDDVLDPSALTTAVAAIERGVGEVSRLAGALEQLQTPLADVREALGIEGLRPITARNFRDKDRMKDVLREHGVPVAKSVLAGSLDGLRAFAESVGYPIIVKPQAGLGARATHRIESKDDLDALSAAGLVPSQERPLQAEEFVRAREHTCETVTIQGEPVWRSGTRYFPGPLETLENPWMQYCVLLPREDDNTEWTRFAEINGAALAALFGAEGRGTAAGTALTHMEWFLKDDGRMLVNEVGVRPPGVGIMPLMSIAHEMDFIGAWAELIAHDRFTPRPRAWAAGAAFLRGHGGGERVVRVEGVDEVVRALGDSLVELRAPKVGQPRAEGYEGEGTAFVRSATTEGAKQALLKVIETIQVRYE